MILTTKSIDENPSKMVAAGNRHEHDVAFYLSRAFADNEGVFVFNDLKLERNGNIAQIDHLVIHKYGFIVVESKSIYGEVKVNARGEWSRSYRGQWKGMPSPIKQAELQINILKDLLQDHADELLGKILGIRKGFGAREYEIICAVSSTAIVHRDEIPEEINSRIFKSEFVADRIRDITAEVPAMKNLLSSDTRIWFNKELKFRSLKAGSS